METFNAILVNMILLFGMIFLLSLTERNTDVKHTFLKALQGIVIGLVTIFIMLNAWELREGVFFDARSVILSMTGLFFPFITGFIATIISIIYRFIIGGDGIYAGSLSMVFAFVIGVLFKYYDLKKAFKHKILYYYVFGLTVHFFVVLAQLLHPYPTNIDIIQSIGLIMILTFPIATALLAYAFLHYENTIKTRKALRISEKRYRTLISNSKLGILQYNTNGIITIANDSFANTLGTTRDKLIGLDMFELPNKKLVLAVKESLEGIPSLYKGYYQSAISKKTFPTRVQFSPILEDNEVIGVIGVVEDLSEEYTMNKKLKTLTKNDSLTKVLNRAQFDDFLLSNHQTSYPTALILYNINAFQIINRSFGFEKGNDVLVEIATKLKTKINDIQGAHIFRVGGDEFAIVLENTHHEESYETALVLKDFINKESSFDFEYSVCFGYAIQKNKKDTLVDVYQEAQTDLKKQKVYEGSMSSKKTIDIIMRTLFDKSKREKQHSDRVSYLAQGIANYYAFDSGFNNRVALAGRLHDIGKINISEELLDKTTSLTQEEWKRIKKHPESGFKILSSVEEYLDIANIVYAHHERYDGTGYPKGLKGEAIPLEARIISVADAFDAMTKTRTYRAPISEAEAIKELIAHKGTQFDPDVVDKFVTYMKQEHQNS